MKIIADKVHHALVCTAALTLLGMGSGCSLIRQRQADVHVDRGQRLLADDELEVALAEFQAAVELDPQLAVAHSKMGVIYQRMGEYERAIESFANAIRYNPFSFTDSLNLAQLYHFTKRLHDAVEVYLHACDLKPDDFDAQLNLGVCYQQMGEVEQAVERFQNAIEIDADRPHAFVNLGVAFDTQGKYYEAIHSYQEALERDNHQPLVLVNLSHTYMKQDRLKIARVSLETAIDLDGQLAPAHEALGYCLFRMQDYDGAEQAYKNAAAYDAELPNTFAGLGSIYALRYVQDRSRTNLRDRALDYWHRSLELDPDQPKIRNLVAKYKPPSTDPETILLTDHQPDR
ncbi:MAG TPA: tetratricopeptide repeat protein [Phycisphaerae bacterium]|nr:tetratricopeptide repeat protein [Phycisphaerae bacterium]